MNEEIMKIIRRMQINTEEMHSRGKQHDVNES